MENNLRPIEYKGFVLIPEERGGFLVKAKCDEIAFLIEGILNYPLVSKKFREAVDEVMSNKVPTSEPEKELNRLKTLLENEPAVFYGTNQVYDLLTLCEDLVEASKKKELKTKRVDELEVGDIVILPYSKGVSTVSEVKGVRYKVVAEGISEPRFYNYDEEVTYFGNKGKGE